MWLTTTEFINNLNDHYAQVGGGELESDISLPAAKFSYEFSVCQIKSFLRQIKSQGKATIADDYPSCISRNFAKNTCIPVCDIMSSMIQKQRYLNIYKQLERHNYPKHHCCR